MQQERQSRKRDDDGARHAPLHAEASASLLRKAEERMADAEQRASAAEAKAAKYKCVPELLSRQKAGGWNARSPAHQPYALTRAHDRRRAFAALHHSVKQQQQLPTTLTNQ